MYGNKTAAGTLTPNKGNYWLCSKVLPKIIILGAQSSSRSWEQGFSLETFWAVKTLETYKLPAHSFLDQPCTVQKVAP